MVDNIVAIIILSHMVEYNKDKVLSARLKAVSDTTRRKLLTQLCQNGPERVTDLAHFYDMSLNAISKHIKVLESSGLVKRNKTGRTHWIEANLDNIKLIENWLSELRSIWDIRLDKLNDVIQTGDYKDE